jgi:type IV secretory pathway VirJ component
LRDIFTLLCLGNKSTYHLVVSAWVGRNDDIDDEEEKKVVTCG